MINIWSVVLNNPEKSQVGAAGIFQNTHSTELILMFEKSVCWDSNPLTVDLVDCIRGVSRKSYGPKVPIFSKIARFLV